MQTYNELIDPTDQLTAEEAVADGIRRALGREGVDTSSLNLRGMAEDAVETVLRLFRPELMDDMSEHDTHAVAALILAGEDVDIDAAKDHVEEAGLPPEAANRALLYADRIHKTYSD
jgi:hypothetical protein